MSLSSHSAVPSSCEAVGLGLRLHDAVSRIGMREVLLDAAEDGLQRRVLRLDPGEQRLVHLEFARDIAERPLGDLGEAALGGHVGDDGELQPAVGGIARLLLQDPEQRLGDVGAGRPDRDEGVARGDAAHDRDAFLGIAAVVEKIDGEPGLGAVAERDAAGPVDLLSRRLHGGLAVDAEHADHAGLGAEAGDLDRALLGERSLGCEQCRNGKQRRRDDSQSLHGFSSA